MVAQKRAAEWESLDPWEKAAQWEASSPEISAEVMNLARQRAEHQMRLEEKRVDHEQRMDIRRWAAQLITIGLGTLNTVLLVVLAWHYADSGQIWPGLAMFGAGSGLTAGAYAVGRSIGGPRERVAQSSGL
ncbi:hypothetical protein [Micromonospora sp. LOL_021]|uniref:hypothetical protein n=1 Tax=Micromonospora sp. LOL_021 TaxID=3345417 RepID=UPI003A88DC6B